MSNEEICFVLEQVKTNEDICIRKKNKNPGTPHLKKTTHPKKPTPKPVKN